MGIQLDWNIESDRGKQGKHSEDPQRKRSRRLALFRLLLAVVVLLLIIGAVIFLIADRLRIVDEQIAQLLRDTVEAEVAALRLGDRSAYLDLQRSATDDWLRAQEIEFAEYQQLKLTSDIQLVGQVTDVEVDGQRGRAQVQEIIDGVPYTRTWFYWRYNDLVVDGRTVAGGWRHVPPDYTFWGEPDQIEGDGFVVRYREVDEPVAQALSDQLARWLEAGCSLLDCTGLPMITVDVIISSAQDIGWSQDTESWQLLVPSPFVDRARSDMPFDLQMQIDAATALATRLIDGQLGFVPAYPSDAYYLRSSVISWMVGRFVQRSTNAYLVDSLARNYGDDAVTRLLDVLQPESRMDVLSEVVGAPDLATVNLDWRDLLSWRLVIESDLLQRGAQDAWLALYDTRDDAVRQQVYARYDSPPMPEPYTVLQLTPVTAADGTPQLQALTQIGTDGLARQEIIVFNLVNNVWLRAS